MSTHIQLDIFGRYGIIAIYFILRVAMIAYKYKIKSTLGLMNVATDNPSSISIILKKTISFIDIVLIVFVIYKTLSFIFKLKPR